MTSDSPETLRLRLMRCIRKARNGNITPGTCVDEMLQEMENPGADVWNAADGMAATDYSGRWGAMLQAIRSGK